MSNSPNPSQGEDKQFPQTSVNRTAIIKKKMAVKILSSPKSHFVLTLNQPQQK